MSATRKLVALSAAVLLLTGCAPGPTRDEVSERILIEFTDDDTKAEYFTEVADTMADDALDGLCGDIAYESWVQESGGDLFYAWRQTCMMYFEDDLTPTQIDETKRMITDRIAEETEG